MPILSVRKMVKKRNADAKHMIDPNNEKAGPANMSRQQIKKTKKPLKT